jgi:pyruvate,water dikinase
MDDISIVGGKNASLSEMIANLTSKNISVPDGFSITTHAYDKYLEFNNIGETINTILENLDHDDHINLKRCGLKIRTLIQDGKFPEDIYEEIIQSYRVLSKKYRDSEGNPQEKTDVAVRSSGTAEDLPDASFAGQQETYLNVRGKSRLMESIKNCFASLFTDRAISYRRKIGYDNKKVKISVGVQKMVRSDLGSSGVAFTLDPISGFKNSVLVNGSLGLGENVVGGKITPDEFVLSKRNLKSNHYPILDKKLGDKTFKMIYDPNPRNHVTNVKVSEEERYRFCISDEDLIELGNWCLIIEDYYSEKYGKWTPVDIEWAYDGLLNQLFIVQARPETVISNRKQNVLETYKIKDTTKNTVLTKGVAVGDKISTGRVKIIYSLDDRDGSNGEDFFEEGDILVTDITTPDWENLMQKAGGIITNKGGRVCHAAIIAREFGIPTIVGTGNCTEVLRNFDTVTVSCVEGDTGFVYQGSVDFEKESIDLQKIEDTKTKLMLNIANPETAFKNSFLPHSGVGLLRLEFIINNFIKAHPNALLAYDMNMFQENDHIRNKISNLISGYKNGKDYYMEKLITGIGRIAEAFYPERVIVRFSDFKSNEYKSLLGGSLFEPDEENPMIGWRGCSRYYSENFCDAFKLECDAIKFIREEMNMRNVTVMLPFCRTIDEVIKVEDKMKEYGLERGVNDLEIYLMCEIPSNVVLGAEFSEYVDGFSIGSNDLTQMTLGLDRDSGLVSHLFDENNEAVRRMISLIINICKMKNKKIGICGQAPSDYPEFTKFLVEKGIDSVSLMPDSLVKTKLAVRKIEESISSSE